MRIGWKEIPKEQTLFQIAAQYPDFKPKSLELFLKLMWVTAQLDRALEGHFGEWDLSRGRFMLLMMLYKGFCGVDTQLPAGVMSPSDLAAHLDVTRGNMTGLIDGLEREGWLRREDDPEDRRGLLVVLTQVGKERLEKILPVHFRRMGLLLSNLTPAEADAVLAIIPKLMNGMNLLREDISRTDRSGP